MRSEIAVNLLCSLLRAPRAWERRLQLEATMTLSGFAVAARVQKDELRTRGLQCSIALERWQIDQLPLLHCTDVYLYKPLDEIRISSSECLSLEGQAQENFDDTTDLRYNGLGEPHNRQSDTPPGPWHTQR